MPVVEAKNMNKTNTPTAKKTTTGKINKKPEIKYSAKETRRHHRVQILLAYYSDPLTTLRQLQEVTGLASLQSVEYHIVRLRKEGLLIEEFKIRGPRLTEKGELLVGYIQACDQGESLYNKMAKKYLDGTSRIATQAINEEVKRLDAIYARTKDGAVRRDPKTGKNVLERKVSGSEILKAAKKYTSSTLAANAIGLARFSFEERLLKLFERAKATIERDKQGLLDRIEQDKQQKNQLIQDAKNIQKQFANH